MRMYRISAIGRIIFLDGMRRYALLGLIALALAAEFSGLFFMDFIGRDIGRASSDFLFSIMWMAGLLFLLFHAVQVIAWDEEGGAIYALLSRPVSRYEYVLGVFLGLALLLLALQALLGLVAYGSLLLIQGSVDPIYFTHLSLSHYVLSWSGLVVMQLVILSAIMVFSGLVRGGFVVLILTAAYYGICSGLPVVRESVRQQMAHGQDISILSGLLKAITSIFPDFNRLDFKDAITAAQYDFNVMNVSIDFAVGGLYGCVMLTIACWMYAKRDLS